MKTIENKKDSGCLENGKLVSADGSKTVSITVRNSRIVKPVGKLADAVIRTKDGSVYFNGGLV